MSRAGPLSPSSLAIACSALACSGCLATLEIELPDDPRARSVLLIVGGGLSPSITAHDRSAGGELALPGSRVLRRGDHIITLFYAAPLLDLGLAAGELDLAAESEPGRPIPRFDRGLVLELEDLRGSVAASDFQPLTPGDAAIDSLRLTVPTTDEACAEAGGCYVDTEVCTVPCPAPEPDAPVPPSPPGEPALPTFRCAGGWHRAMDEVAGVETCAAPERGPAATCAEAEAPLYDGTGCAVIGASCPGGKYAAALPVDRPILYVDAEAGPGGDGSLAAPYARIAEALAGALPGTVVALGKGEHESGVVIPAGVALFGACPLETIIVSPPGATAVTAVEADVELRNLRVRGGAFAAAVDGRGATLSLEGVIVEESDVGLHALRGGSLTARDVAIRGTGGAGVVVAGPSVCELTRVAVHDFSGAGLWAQTSTDTEPLRLVIAEVLVRGSRGSTAYGSAGLHAANARLNAAGLVIEDVIGEAVELSGALTATISDLWASPSEAGAGRGVIVAGARVRLERAWIQHGNGFGAVAIGPGAELTLASSVVADTHLEPTGEYGIGVAAVDRARLRLEGAVVRNSVSYGISIVAATASVSDVVVATTRARPLDGAVGWGLWVASATVGARRVLLADSTAIGLGATAGRLEVEDLIIRDTRAAEAEGRAESGIHAAQRADIRVARARVERSARFGVYLGDPGTRFEAEDLTVTDTGIGRNIEQAEAGLISWRALVILRRAAFERNARAGVDLVLRDARGDFEDLTVRGSGIGASRSDHGGLMVRFGATAEARRVLVEEGASFAVIVSDNEIEGGRSSSAVLSDVTIRDVAGVGIAVTTGATVGVDRAAVFGARREGVVVEDGSAASIANLTVQGVSPDANGMAAAFHIANAPAVDLRRFRLAGSTGYGLAVDAGLLFSPARFSMREGTIEDNAIGLRIAATRLELSALMRGVRYSRNGVLLETE